MLVEAYLNALTSVLDLLFGWITLPPLPDWLGGSVIWFIDLIFDNLGIVGFFIRWETLVNGAFWAVSIIAVEHTYLITMWVLRKIPALGID